MKGKLLQEVLQRPLIDFEDVKPHFKSEEQKREYEHALCDAHCCEDRHSFIHSKKGAQIVLLYMQVWKIGPQQAMRELITDEAYTLSIARAPVGR